MAVAQYININGRNVHVNIIGEGVPIVFLHGGPGSEHRFFLPYVLPLAKKFQLILYDQRGCGKSDSLLDQNYSMEEEVKTLEALRIHLQLDKINLFGESWGSMLALLYATTYPEKVNKIFLTAAIGINQQGFQQFKKELLRKISLKDKVKLLITERNIKKGIATLDDALTILDPYYVFSKQTLTEIDKISINHTINQILVEDIENHYDLTDKVNRLANIPILIAQGSHDILSPAMIQKLIMNYLPHAELHEISACGHWTIIEKPNEMNTLTAHFFNLEFSLNKK